MRVEKFLGKEESLESLKRLKLCKKNGKMRGIYRGSWTENVK